MDFEQALSYELQAIPELVDRVFPQMAIDDLEPPFVVYISSEGERVQTLSGYTDLTELSCEIHILTGTYENLKSLTKVVISQITSFFNRNIGINGPRIKSVSYVEPIEDYENELNIYRSSFDIRVRF
jgi:hypothetical protein